MRYLLALAMLVPTGAAAQDCPSYLGTSPSLTSITDALAQFENVTPKDEFETTAQYEARIAAATGGSGPLVIPKAIDEGQLTYDADRQVFQIGRFFFDNVNMPIRELWSYGGPFYEAGNFQSRSDNIDTVIEQDDVPTGTYTGSNAFGASTEVIQLDRVYWGIYDRPVTGRGGSSFAASYLVPTEGDAEHIGELPMAPAEARQFRETAKVAFVVVPQAPWLINYREDYPSEATVRNPLEVTTVMHVLFADIQCALILDASNTVVSAFETR